jgi:predicted RNA binding protein YcfA (HicA-like mRNA interferase family)
MSDLPSLNASEVIRALERGGFGVTRIRGSHHMLKHTDGRSTTVPSHRGRDIDRRLLRKVIKDAGLTVVSS